MHKLRTAIAGILALLTVAPAAAQIPQLPANTVFGRLGIGTGPGQAIPFSTLSAQLGGAAIMASQYGVTCDGTTDDAAAMRRAISAAIVASKRLIIQSGTCKIGSELTISSNFVYIEGQGVGNTRIKFAPTAAGNLWKWSSGTNSVFGGGLSRMTLESDDSTFLKTAIFLKDVRDFEIDDVQITGGITIGQTNYWSGADSIGLLYQGRDGLRTNGLNIAADRPMVWQANPNSSISIDIAQFNKTQLIANGHPGIEAEAGVTASRVTFNDLWIGLGTYGFYSNGSTTAGAWSDISFNGFATEQGTSSSSYSIYMASTSHFHNGVAVHNAAMDPSRKGIFLRNVITASLNNIMFAGSAETYNIDNTSSNIATSAINGVSGAPVIGSGVFADNIVNKASNLTPVSGTYTNVSTNKVGFNVLSPQTTLHVGNSGIAAGSDATNHGTIQIDSGQTDASVNGIEWKSVSSGAGFGWRMPTVFDGSTNIDLYFQSRQSSASWTRWMSIKGSDGSLNVFSGILNVAGSSSGLVSIKTQAAAGTYNFNLPTSAGTSGQPLLSGGGGSSPQTYGTLGVAAGGTGATTAQAAMAALKGVYILGSSAVASSVTGTLTETALATITVPANAMGLNGRVRITTVWSYTNSANNKTMRHKFGTASYNTFTSTTTASGRFQTEIQNRNATNSQSGFASGVGTGTVGAGWGFTTGANLTSAVDTTAATDILLTAQLANTGETITLESYLVELIVP